MHSLSSAQLYERCLFCHTASFTSKHDQWSQWVLVKGSAFPLDKSDPAQNSLLHSRIARVDSSARNIARNPRAREGDKRHTLPLLSALDLYG